MFCGECGSKLKKGAHFCEECGAKVEEETLTEKKTNLKKKKPMSKSKKIGIITAVVIILALIISYNILNNHFSPKNVAKSYLEALKTNDSDKIYNYLELEGDTTFVTKKMFKNIFESDDNKLSKIMNYNIENVTYGKGKLTANVKFNVTVEDSSDSNNVYIKLIKDKNKKLLIFDNWKISDDSIDIFGIDVVKDYQIKVPKNSQVSINNIKLESKYLDKDKSTEDLDIYVVPQIFSGEIEFTTILENGIEIKEVEEVSNYSSYTATLSLDNLSEEMKTTLENQIKTDLNNLYQNIIAKKDWNTVKESYNYDKANLEDLEETYTDLYERIAENKNTTLNKFEITDFTLTSAELDDGKLELKGKYNYNYSIKYNFLGEERTKEDKDSYTSSITYDYVDNTYKLNQINSTVRYFSTW